MSSIYKISSRNNCATFNRAYVTIEIKYTLNEEGIQNA